MELPAQTKGLERSDGVRIDVRDTSVCLEEPGVYFMEPSGGVVVINVAREERRFDGIPMEHFEALGLPVLKVESGGAEKQSAALRSTEEVSNEVMAARDVESRQSWWRFVLGAVIVVLGIETLWSANVAAGRIRVV
jgi:hypothetical protein